ncbi:MmgE/PrpD family protein [Pseudoduganella umbonata]|uniref:2-methylcitrate dehydratase PrpD n=1 Tax=Pseudoduganella umbonata TaxID=864828 RepID=A0A4P8HJZ5_9BURK|nr:MmgE/PrpD family protein [Pseudoduganella umbonata]MBB3221609.1 2-methylcitrate dehydratase PrpD [Pseudoduganella umbonata]QCP09156.1 MmgE/PrpD family protein [Pseudoduganella umbonata]
MSDTISLTIAKYAASTSIAGIPAEVRERARKVIFDEIACAFFARRSLAGALAARFAAQSGGLPEARILATGQRVPAASAALANGTAGHGEEVDGAHVVGGHPGASIVHAALALAERQRASGAELLNAVVLGYDVGVRIVEACGGLFSVKNRFSLNSDFLFAIGCAVAGGRLLGLDPERQCHAMALSSFSSNALCALYAEKRHISKSLCNGQFAAAGVTAALMAAAGLQGNEDIIGAPHGVLDAWGEDGQRVLATRGLGDRYAIMGANFKFLNCGYPIHAAVEAALALIAKHAIDTGEIVSVDVGMPTDTMKVVDNRAMHNICLQDMLSAALVRGGLGLRESPFPAVLSDPAYIRLRPLVTLRGDADLDHYQPNGRGATVAISTRSRPTVSMRIDHPRGHSLRGEVSWHDLAAKWRDGLPECDVDRMLEAAQGLEDLDDVGTLLDAFTTRH